jgi:hypothetical protein
MHRAAMDQTIARKLLIDELQILKTRPFSFFTQSINRTIHKEKMGPDGVGYQIEVEVIWDSRRGGNIRVMGSVHDGKVRSVKPLTEDFIITPAGTFLVT